MILRDLLRDADAWLLRGDWEIEISGIASDSRKVRPGMAFFCLCGFRHDGNQFARKAVENGAVAVITQARDSTELMAENVTLVGVKDARIALAMASAAFYGNPARELITIGVTGTKGKTTCTYLIKSILENAGQRVGLIGTNEVIIGREHLKTENTTPDAILLHDYMRRMVSAGGNVVVMEVSSQAIKLHRTDGIRFDYGIFTNLSPDHVAPGEHEEFQEYLAGKRQRFRQCKVGIVNADDAYVDKITEGRTCILETYGMSPDAMLRAQDVTRMIVNDRPGSRFQVTGLMDFEAKLPMPGRFSIYNALAAISLCRHFRVRESDVQRSLLSASVAGRIECARSQDGWYVLIDYAHNPAALASLLEALREYRPGRLICVFGCGGDRPVMRRVQMGRISGKLADLTIITDDNPRSEDPAVIREQIAEGVLETEGEYRIIPGRREAIRYALSIAQSGDLIVLAGKGHETYQEIQGKRIPMDERKMIREILEETCHTQT